MALELLLPSQWQVCWQGFKKPHQGMGTSSSRLPGVCHSRCSTGQSAPGSLTAWPRQEKQMRGQAGAQLRVRLHQGRLVL